MEKQMNKSQLVQAVATKTGLSNNAIDKMLDGLTEVIQEELKTPGNEVALVGVGKLKSKRKAARTAKQFGEVKDIPAHTAVSFAISGVLKSAINS
jgi:DNA-binding protein HU-beta